VGDDSINMTCRKPDHERRAKPERQEVFLDRVRGKNNLPDGHSGDHCECCGSVCDCMDHRTIEALSVKMTESRIQLPDDKKPVGKSQQYEVTTPPVKVQVVLEE